MAYSPPFIKLFTPALHKLEEIFTKYNYEVRIVGGAVRDLVLKRNPKDIDISTNATPNEMIEIFNEEDIKYSLTGLKHGTITVHINNESFEVTTLRIDTTTNGRHAQVDFTKDWKIDSERRDLTCNAMSLRFDGTLFDYFNGKDDLENDRILFVGNADQRIKEDYLRILRYFRIHGCLTKNGIHDSDTLNHIKNNAVGLEQISGERIWMEMQRILTGSRATQTLRFMIQTSVTNHIKLPCLINIDEFDKVSRYPVTVVTLLASLLFNNSQANEMAMAWKLSKNERQLLFFIISHRHDKLPSEKQLRNMLIKGVKLYYIVELLLYHGNVQLAENLKTCNIPKFPVSGQDLIQHGYKPGKIMGEILKELRNMWMESNYKLTKEYLINTGIDNI